MGGKAMKRERDRSLIEVLWDKHWRRISDSYHRNMAAAFRGMLADELCTAEIRSKLLNAIGTHKSLERRFPEVVPPAFTVEFPEE
jgi:hypothetical protein